MRELTRRTTITPVRREVGRAATRISTAVQIEETIIRAKTVVGEFAVNEVSYLKSMQREVEHRNPDAADAVAFIINTTINAIARDVAQFGVDL